MSAAAVLARARAAGLAVEARGDRLHLRGQEPTPDLMADLRQHKPALVRLLTGEDHAEAPTPASPSPTPPPPSPTTRPSSAARMLTGLMHASLQRPPAWPGGDVLPSPECFCSCCHGRAWWAESVEPKGWRCSTCHPPVPGHSIQVGRT
jgi:hypothetical protein